MPAKPASKVVVLAGGKGTRFRPFSFVIPKPLMPIGENPILLHLIDQFKKYAIREFYVSTGYQAELVRAYFGDGSRFGVNIQYFHEEKPLGTAGPLSLMKSHFEKDEYLFLINGDIYTETKFDEMAKFAKDHQYDLVVGYIEKKERSAFGVLEIQNQEIKGIIEKPESTFQISSGIYVIHSSAINSIPENEFFTMPDLILHCLKTGKKVGAYPIQEFWIGIENVENMDLALARIEGKKA